MKKLLTICGFLGVFNTSYAEKLCWDGNEALSSESAPKKCADIIDYTKNYCLVNFVHDFEHGVKIKDKNISQWGFNKGVFINDGTPYVFHVKFQIVPYDPDKDSCYPNTSANRIIPNGDLWVNIHDESEWQVKLPPELSKYSKIEYDELSDGESSVVIKAYENESGTYLVMLSNNTPYQITDLIQHKVIKAGGKGSVAVDKSNDQALVSVSDKNNTSFRIKSYRYGSECTAETKKFYCLKNNPNRNKARKERMLKIYMNKSNKLGVILLNKP